MRRGGAGVPKISVATLVSLSIAVIIIGCVPATPPAQTGSGNAPNPSAPQKTLVIAQRGEPPTLAARSLVTQGSGLLIPDRFFNATLDVWDMNQISHPQLAQALPELNTDTWRMFPDGRMETRYTLRPNLTWHDGTPLHAEDFAFALRVYKTPELGSSSTRPIPQMDEIVVQDARTFVIRWKQPYVDASGLHISFQALPRHLLEADFAAMDAVAFTGHPFWTFQYLGLGPYKLDRWEAGSFLEASAFDNFALGRPKIERIRILIINDPQTAMASVLAGEIQFVTNFMFSVDQGQVLEQRWSANGGGTVLYSPTQRRLGLVQMRPEHQQPRALADVRVRYALAHSMDDQARVDVVDGGKGRVAYTLASEGYPYYPELEKVVLKHPYDPRRAQELMAEAGWIKGADGFFRDASGERFTIEVASSAGGKNEQEAAIYVDGLRKVGFDAHQYVTPVAQIDDNETRATRSGISLRGGGEVYEYYIDSAIPSPANRWRGDNRPGWSNAEYNRTFAILERTFAMNERIQLMAELERQVSLDRALLMNSWESLLNVVAAGLHGVEMRQVPNINIGPELFAHQWEWRS
jgi:peptide/nickel transport system substrate-binding protein